MLHETNMKKNVRTYLGQMTWNILHSEANFCLLKKSCVSRQVLHRHYFNTVPSITKPRTGDSGYNRVLLYVKVLHHMIEIWFTIDLVCSVVLYDTQELWLLVTDSSKTMKEDMILFPAYVFSYFHSTSCPSDGQKKNNSNVVTKATKLPCANVNHPNTVRTNKLLSKKWCEVLQFWLQRPVWQL